MCHDAETLIILIFTAEPMYLYKKHNTHPALNKFVFVTLLLLFPTLIIAQEVTVPGSLLPDIDPQDIEIRGEFSARFPGIMRQPILGFSPRPRVFQIDPNRMPFLESPEQVVATLPLSDLERSSPPEFTYYKRPDSFNFWSTTGIGNYMAPEIDIYMGLPIGENTLITGSVNTVSSGSYLEESSPQVSSFRNFDAGLGVVHYFSKKSRFDAGFTTRWDKNHLAVSEFTVPVYGFITSSIAIPSDFYPGVEISPDNNMIEYGGNFGYRYNVNQLSFWDIALETKYYSGDVEKLNWYALTTDVVGETRRAKHLELKHGVALRKDWTGKTPGNVFSAQLSGNFAEYNLDGDGKKSWFIGTAGMLYRTRIGYKLRTEIGARAFYSGDENNKGVVHVFPEINAIYSLNNDVKIKGEVSGFVLNAGLGGLSKINRRLYTYTDPENERGLTAKASIELDIYEGLKVQSGFKYTYFLRHGYYTLDSELPQWSLFELMPGPSNDLMAFTYLDGANIIKWDASIWYDLMPEKFTIYAGVYAQWHGDKNGDEIPFRENIGFSAGGTYAFTQRSKLQIWSDYTGSRKVASGRNDSRGYILLNAKYDFWASREIGAYIKITNLLDQRYTKWVGYDELPAQVYGGVMLKF